MTDYKYDFVKVSVADGIAWAALNRPEKRNPLNEEVVLEFEGLLHQVRDDRECRNDGKAEAEPVMDDQNRRGLSRDRNPANEDQGAQAYRARGLARGNEAGIGHRINLVLSPRSE